MDLSWISMVQRSFFYIAGRSGSAPRLKWPCQATHCPLAWHPVGPKGESCVVCPTLSNQDAMKIDQILRIVEDFSLFFAILTMWKPSSSKICEHEFLRQLQNKEQIRKIKIRKEKTTPDSNPHSTFCFRRIQTFAANLLLFFSFFLSFSWLFFVVCFLKSPLLWAFGFIK